MIPEKLQLRNFMSYREGLPPLSLDGIHIACLSGENGAGKSALLDAITWSLWGKARVSSDDELITLGEQEMEVDFQFTLADSRYRVLRRRSSARRGQTLLEIQTESSETGGWRSISGNNVRETQAVINALLRMEYDTFVNSAFLLQGKADEFTRKTPAERKRVLGEVLGLDAYDRLETRAKDQAKDLERHIHGLEARIADYRNTVSKRELYLQQATEAQTQVDQLGQHVDAATARHTAAVQQQRDLEAQVQQREQAQTAIRDVQHRLTTHQREIAAVQHDIDTAQAIEAQAEQIDAGYAALEAARNEKNRLDDLREQAVVIRDQKRDVQSRIEAELYRLQSHRERLDADIQRNTDTIAQRPALEQEHQQLANQLAELGQLSAELAAARTEREHLEHQAQVLADLLLKQQQWLHSIDLVEDSLIAAREATKRRINELETHLRNEARWRDELDAATAQQRDLQRNERRLTELRAQDQADSIRLGELQARAATIEAQGKQVREKITLLQHSGDTTCPLCRSQIGHTGINDIEQQYVQERKHLLVLHQEATLEARQLKIEVEARRREINGLERKTEQLPAFAAQIARLENDLRDAETQRRQRAEEQATLQTLEAQLDHKDYAHDERANLAQVQHDIAALQIDQATLERRRRALTQRISELERLLGERGKLEGRLTVLNNHFSQIDVAEQALTTLRDQILTLQVQIDSEGYAHADRVILAQLTAQMNALGYGTGAHEAIKAQVADLQHWDQARHNLRQAQTSLPSLRRHHAQLSEGIERSSSEIEALQVQIAQLVNADIQLRAARIEANAAQQQVQQLTADLGRWQRNLGAAQHDIERVNDIAEQLETAEYEHAALQEEREIYAELAKAFGKKGIQAMLIETAIPELEHVANELLGRMTDNQMHLSFETQRSTKKGDPAETLDIHIADAQGTRRYDLYSGGEAFRINFAIRIAISKMLAHRAGANLQTLIIDEGFGSQDGRGRERLVEAINHIQPDFARILVITHIQELKDQFPVQIEITKTAEGSRWAIN